MNPLRLFHTSLHWLWKRRKAKKEKKNSKYKTEKGERKKLKKSSKPMAVKASAGEALCSHE
jgi:hypothetical protein